MLSRSFEVRYDGQWLVENQPAKDLFCGNDSFLDEMDRNRQRGFTLCLTLNPFGADYTLYKFKVVNGEFLAVVYKIKGSVNEVHVDLEKLNYSVTPSTIYAKILPLPVYAKDVPKNNSMMALDIFWNGCAWVFNAPAHGLVEEPFVCGADEMLDKMVEQQKLKDPRQNGFTAIFSAQKFPTAQYELTWEEECSGGNYYKLGEMRGWLCPAMYHYFEVAPKSIFVEVKGQKL